MSASGGIFWKRFKRNRLALWGGIVVIVLFLIAIFADILSPFEPDAIDRRHILEPPTSLHPLGTDDLGRDVLSRMIFGSRISLSVGFVAVGIASVIGMIFGALAGYYGGWPDRIIMRFIDIMLSIPTFFLILAVIAFIGPSIWNIMIVIGVTSWMGIARLVRAEFLSLKEREFVLAAQAIGAGDLRIIFGHIMVNSMAPVFVSAILGVASAILVESALSFLGIGIQPPIPSWGNILTIGKDNLEIAWWLSIFPGIAILVTGLSYYLVGEGLRDALDPRLRSGSK
ncbi:MAG: ABC transporter permease [Nitrospirae bacterium]|nr:ABC transporter permease [Nitrospirota bacterium]